MLLKKKKKKKGPNDGGSKKNRGHLRGKLSGEIKALLSGSESGEAKRNGNASFAPHENAESVVARLRDTVLRATSSDSSAGGIPAEKRGLVWKIFLGVESIDAERYLDLVSRGEHSSETQNGKIKKDAPRTLATDELYLKKMPNQDSLVRVLNAFLHAHDGEYLYVQGMNVLCAPLLCVMPEPDAFYAFDALITKAIPAYVCKNMNGVNEGCDLLRDCLEHADPSLAAHLARSKVPTKIYGFAPILTLRACSPPLKSVLRLWDVFLAGGVHLSLVSCVAELILKRETLLGAEQRGEHRHKCLKGRDFPMPVTSNGVDALVSLTLSLVRSFPDDLVDRLTSHVHRVD